MNFDLRGNLAQSIELTFQEFKEAFVTNWAAEDTTRASIFNVFETYIADFQVLITPDFITWVDGSFVSNKKSNPNDIDFVSFVDSKIYDDKTDLVNKRFGKFGVKEFYGKYLDAYICPVYPENHQKAFYTKSDTMDWLHQFSHTKPKKLGDKSFSKGFITIKFQ